MATRTLSILTADIPAVREEAPAIPWYVWASVVGVTSAIVGGHWDISWHRSIGRDDFWTPAHIAIYLCGVIAGISSAYLILATTFGKSLYPREATVKIWGFRGPIGAFITAWGGVAMLTSAPFDDWWHNAYGLDVKIFSPPHVLLILGILAIQVGALLLMLGYMNRAEGTLKRQYNFLFLYVGGMILLLMSVLILEFTNRIYMHSGFFYRTVAIAIPAVFVGIAYASRLPWAATAVAAVYTIFMLGFQWILPLFPAEPKLGPVMNPVTNFVPPQFPLLYLFPALALDLLRPSLEQRNRWVQAAVYGLTFLGILLAIQWPFGDFLMSDAAKNGFFGSHRQDYATGPNAAIVRGLFIAEKTPAAFWQAMGLAVLAAILTSRLGLAWGVWMRKVQR
jgi:hypothetical protein